jgi:hypothetical protein
MYPAGVVSSGLVQERIVTSFTPLPALIGGALIGTSATVLFAFEGRIAGICGILGGVLQPRPGEVAWRAWFLAGLLAGGLVMSVLTPAAFVIAVPRSTGTLVAAGLLVGVGTRLGNGCTSGHGVCGISRLSVRSIVATCVFMAAAALTVYVGDHLLAGRL